MSGQVELVLPYRESLEEGLEFARSKAAWIARRLAKVRPPIPFADGLEFPLIGDRVRVRLFEQSLRAVDREGDDLCVSGCADDVSPLVEAWLRREARREIGKRAAEKSDVLGRPHGRITIRDPHTLLGSCSRA